MHGHPDSEKDCVNEKAAASINQARVSFWSAKETPQERANRLCRYYAHSTPADQVKFDALRASASGFMANVLAMCPDNADRAAAERKIREALQTSIASIVVPQPDGTDAVRTVPRY